jgi:hypothetical protein
MANLNVRSDASVIGPRHDGRVVDDAPMVAYEFEGTTAGAYAKPT